jgi:hypothetical protein
MPSRTAPLGNSVGNMNGLMGSVTAVSLITAASGTGQSGYIMPTDVVVVTAANGSNTSVTLPDPFLQGWGVGDYYEVVNGSGQALVIFPPTGGKINLASANASCALPAAATTNNAAGRYYITAVASAASTFTFCSG